MVFGGQILPELISDEMFKLRPEKGEDTLSKPKPWGHDAVLLVGRW